MEPVEKLPTVSFVADAKTGCERITMIFYPNDRDHCLSLRTTLLGRGTSVIDGRRGTPPEQLSPAIPRNFERETTLSSRSIGRK